jgi:flagellar biosynthesis/type III secretory pathway protein FliH
MKKANSEWKAGSRMSDTFKIELLNPIGSVSILQGHSGVLENHAHAAAVTTPTAITDAGATSVELQNQKELYERACQSIQSIASKLNQFYDEMFTGHKDEIAKLSVEIARKVLMQKVENGEYEIEPIIKEAIKSSPSQQDLVVHLNPQDIAAHEKAMQENGDQAFTGIKFVADQNIGPAECTLESPKGTIESKINEHLDQIAKTLVNTA